MRSFHRALWAVGLLLGVLFGFAVSVSPPASASRNSAGVYSLPSGNPVVSGTSISASWANTTLADISTELTASLDRSGRGAMAAPLQLTSGTASAPALTFSSEPSSGLYRAGASDVRMQVGGTQVQKWSASGSNFPLGVAAVGIAPDGAGFVGAGTGSGSGGAFTGGSTNGAGVLGTGSGIGAGGVFTGGTGPGAGARVSPGSASTSTLRYGALEMQDGDLYFTGTIVNPASTVALSKTLTPKNLINAWVRITTDGGGGRTVADGFNVGSISFPSAQAIRVNFAAPFASANYACTATVGTTGMYVPILANQAVGSIDIMGYYLFTSPPTAIDFTLTALALHLICTGAQ